MKHTGNHLKFICTVGFLAIMLGIIGCESSGDRTWSQKRADREVASAVRKRLDSDEAYKYSNVVPVVYEGTVQLSGWVDTPEHRQRAAELAAYAQGAREIINSIEVKPTPTGRPGPEAAEQPTVPSGAAPSNSGAPASNH